MDDLLIDLAKQVPSLVVLVFLVMRFLSHLSERDESMARVITENTKMLGRAAEAMEQMERKLEKVA